MCIQGIDGDFKNHLVRLETNMSELQTRARVAEHQLERRIIDFQTNAREYQGVIENKSELIGTLEADFKDLKLQKAEERVELKKEISDLQLTLKQRDVAQEKAVAVDILEKKQRIKQLEGDMYDSSQALAAQVNVSEAHKTRIKALEAKVKRGTRDTTLNSQSKSPCHSRAKKFDGSEEYLKRQRISDDRKNDKLRRIVELLSATSPIQMHLEPDQAVAAWKQGCIEDHVANHGLVAKCNATDPQSDKLREFMKLLSMQRVYEARTLSRWCLSGRTNSFRTKDWLPNPKFGRAAIRPLCGA